MALINHGKQCINGTLHTIYEETSIQVLTNVSWDGTQEIYNESAAAYMTPEIDPQGDYTLPQAVQSDPNFNGKPSVDTLLQGSTLKNRWWADEDTDLNGLPIPCP